MTKEQGEIGGIIDDLRRVFQVINEFSKRSVRTAGLTGPQLWTIKTVSEEAPVRVSDLARSMHLHPATVVGILDRLEVRGLVKRIRSTEDRRVVMVELTAQGHDLVRRAPVVAQGLLVSGLEGLSPSQRRTVSEGLHCLVDILGAHQIPPKLFHSPEINKPSPRKPVARKR